MWRFIVLGLFLLAIIFFILPWASVSCSGNELMSASGFDLIKGSYNVTGNLPVGTSLENEPIAIYVLVAACVGVIVSIFKSTIWRFLRVIAGLAGVGFMIWLAVDANNKIQSQGHGMLQLNYLVGSWLTIGAFVLAVVVSLFVRDGIAKKKNSIPTLT